MYEHDGDGARRDRAAQAVARARQGGAGAWRPAREFTVELGGRARGVASGVRQALDRMPELPRRNPANLLLVAAAGGLLFVAAAGFLLRRWAESDPASGDIGRVAPTSAGRGGGGTQRGGGGDTASFRRAGPTTGRPGPGGLGRAGPSSGYGRPGPGGLGGRRETETGGFTGRAVPGPSATTASKAYEVPPGRTTATPATPVDEPVIPAGRETGDPTEPLRRKPKPGR